MILVNDESNGSVPVSEVSGVNESLEKLGICNDTC